MKALVKRESESRGIQRRHARRYRSGKITVVNPGVKGTMGITLTSRNVILKPEVVKEDRHQLPVKDRHDIKLRPPQPIETEEKESVQRLSGISDSVRDQLTEQSLMYYFISHAERFTNWSDDDMKQIAEECSALTAIAPLHLGEGAFGKGELKRLFDAYHKDFKPFKFLSVDEENKFHIEGMSPMSALQIVALFYYAMDRITGGQMEDKFDWVKTAKMLSRGPKKTAEIKYGADYYLGPDPREHKDYKRLKNG